MNIKLKKNFYSKKLDQVKLKDLINILNKNIENKITIQKILDQVIINYNFNKHGYILRSRKAKQVVEQVNTANIINNLNSFDDNFRFTTGEGDEGVKLKVAI
jgi:hypothetical protein